MKRSMKYNTVKTDGLVEVTIVRLIYRWYKEIGLYNIKDLV